MNRRNFLGCACKITTCCGAAMALVETDNLAAENKTDPPPPKAVPNAATPPVTPDREKVDFAKKWIARLMDNLDAIVDQEPAGN